MSALVLSSSTLDRGPRLVAAGLPADAVGHERVVAAGNVFLRVRRVGPGVVGTAVEHAAAQGVPGALRRRPVLADEGRAVGGDRAVGLMGEQELGDAGPGEGVDETEERP